MAVSPSVELERKGQEGPDDARPKRPGMLWYCSNEVSSAGASYIWLHELIWTGNELMGCDFHYAYL